MKKSWVITICREFGSGGLEVAQQLAQRMNIPYYDRDIVDHVVENTNLDRQTVVAHEEKPEKGFLYGRGWYREDPSLVMPVHTRIYESQCDFIRNTAGKGPCVFVGRCADYVLGECPNVMTVVSVFIRADLEKRIPRVMRLYGIGEPEARKLILKTDKIRAKYYTAHTGREWGAVDNYQLIVDTGDFGTDGAAALIEAAVGELTREGRTELQ